MQSNIIDRLLSSFEELEQAIGSAKVALLQKGRMSPEILERLDSYDGILAKQRGLAESLRSHLAVGNWDEVNRHVSLINGLSAMIRDDARAILGALSLNSDVERTDDSANFC